MKGAELGGEWKRLVLESGPEPAWLGPDAPHREVVVSSRARVMRNLRGHRFATSANTAELSEIGEKVFQAAQVALPSLSVFRALSPDERDYLIQNRLLSPDFPAGSKGRLLLLDEARSVSVMVNEEDHLRVQAIFGGWSIKTASAASDAVVEALGSQLEFATDGDGGFLASSPPNCGAGVRTSVLVHLLGLARSRKVVPILKMLREQGLVVRGLFGEGTRSVGGFFQISQLSSVSGELLGAVEYVIRAEGEARREVPRKEADRLVQDAIGTAVTSKTLAYTDCLKLLSHVRWGASIGLVETTAGEIDRFLTSLDARTSSDEVEQSRRRAVQVRAWVERWLRHP